MNTPLALPPPRQTLLEIHVGHIYVNGPKAFWPEYHLHLTRALAYETTLQPTEKVPNRWDMLKRRALFAAQVIAYHGIDRMMRRARTPLPAAAGPVQVTLSCATAQKGGL